MHVMCLFLEGIQAIIVHMMCLLLEGIKVIDLWVWTFFKKESIFWLI